MRSLPSSACEVASRCTGPDDHQRLIDARNVVMITCHDGMTPFTSAQRNMHVDHIVMAGRRTQEPSTSGNVEIHDSNLGIERLATANTVLG
jgi:hypothetical protein